MTALLGAILTVGALIVSASPGLSGRLGDWIERTLTREPDALFRAIGNAKSGNDPSAIVAAARRFLDSIPPPHPADRYGENYRQALREMMSAAEATGDTSARLDAGNRANAFDANDSWLLYHFGLALEAAGQKDLARGILEEAFRIRPTSAHIFTALHRLRTAVSPRLADELTSRHHEALALMMDLPTWMTGNLVAASHHATAVVNPRLSVEEETIVDVPLEFDPSSLYFVLPRVPELELSVVEAALITAEGTRLELTPSPQSHLQRLADGFIRITPTDAVDFDASGVIDFPLPDLVPKKSRMVLRIIARPSPAVAAHRRTFGSWQQPVLPSIPAAP